LRAGRPSRRRDGTGRRAALESSGEEERLDALLEALSAGGVVSQAKLDALTESLAKGDLSAQQVLEEYSAFATTLPPQPPLQPAPCAFLAQGLLLSDEELVEAVLFCVTGRLPRATVASLEETSAAVYETLKNSRRVCHVWRARQPSRLSWQASIGCSRSSGSS